MLKTCKCGKVMAKVVKGPLGMMLNKCECGRVASAGPLRKLSNQQYEKLVAMNKEVADREKLLRKAADVIHCACCGVILKEDTAVECSECNTLVCSTCYDSSKGEGCQCHPEVLDHFTPSEQEVIAGMVTKNACDCSVCGAKADLFRNGRYHCQANGEHEAGSNREFSERCVA